MTINSSSTVCQRAIDTVSPRQQSRVGYIVARWASVCVVVAFGVSVWWCSETARISSAGPNDIGASAPTDVVLAAFWGDAWVERRRELVDSGVDLTVPVLPSRLVGAPSLADVQRHAVDALVESRDRWIESALDLQVQVEALASLRATSDSTAGSSAYDVLKYYLSENSAEEVYAELVAAGHYAFECLVEAQRGVFASGEYHVDYIVAPKRSFGDRTSGRLCSYEAWVEFPWHLTYSIDSGRHPALESAMERLDAIKTDFVDRALHAK